MGMSSGEPGLAQGRAAGLDDATRDACLHCLGDHYAAGRLSVAELDSRVQLALAAQTEDELAAVMAGVVEDPAGGQLTRGRASATGAVRLRTIPAAVAVAVLTSGGTALVLAGPSAAVGAFVAVLAAALVGVLAHRAVTPRSQEDREEPPAEPSPVPSGPVAERPTSSDGPAEGSAPPPPATASVIVPRRVRLNGGVIPTQRGGD
jgi:hypothetical protein